MPIKQPRIKIVKIPLSRSRGGGSVDKNISFPRLPRLYLELLENKNKIKQELINTDYVSKDPPNTSSSPDTPDVSNTLDNDSSPSSGEISESDDIGSDSENIEDVSSPDISSSESEGENKPNDNELSNRLNELLEEGSENNNNKNNPPSLKELEKKGHYVRKKDIPNLEHYKDDQELDDEKRELLYKFDTLKKYYPNAVIPEYTIHSDYDIMSKSYQSQLRRLSLDNAVDSYKTYLMGGFMIVEYVLGEWLRFDMVGFTNYQAVNMHSYEKLLVELGEKSYVPGGSSFPVEIRLLIVVIMNAGLFIVAKMITKKTGVNMLGNLNPYVSGHQQPQQQKPKRRMRGPTIDLDDIPDLTNENI